MKHRASVLMLVLFAQTAIASGGYDLPCPKIAIYYIDQTKELRVKPIDSVMERVRGELCTIDGSWCVGLDLAPGEFEDYKYTQAFQEQMVLDTVQFKRQKCTYDLKSM